MNPICIIPARGGSKRIPRKNVVDVHGRPLIAHTIATAIASGAFDGIYVSTEDAEIAAVAKASGAVPVTRSGELANDVAGVDAVCLDTLHRLEAERPLPELFCCLYATAALLTADDIRASRDMLEADPDAATLMGVSGYPLHPYKALASSNGYVRPLFPDMVMRNTQDFPEVSASNGTIYWARIDAYRHSRSFYSDACLAYVVPPERAIDVDTPDDLERLRAAFGKQR